MTTSASETETLELDPAVLSEPPAPDRTDHLARCASCAFTVRFKPLQSGHGFMLVGSEESLGIGEDGRPMCPNGHGQMEIADDQLPAAEAFALAQEQLQDQRPPRLPFPAPPFNYEGALHEIFEKQSEITRLEIKFTDADERRKKAKSALDDAREELGKMIDVDPRARRGPPARRRAARGRCGSRPRRRHEPGAVQVGRAAPGRGLPDLQRGNQRRRGPARQRAATSTRWSSCSTCGPRWPCRCARGVRDHRAARLPPASRWSEEDRAAVKAWASSTEDGRLDGPHDLSGRRSSAPATSPVKAATARRSAAPSATPS
jgi:hypothetical protein